MHTTQSFHYTRCVGVLGGMGPLAGATFVERLVRLTSAGRDQDHIPVVLVNDPRIPDRTAAQLYGGESPLPLMRRGLRTLIGAGADCIVIPCNTAHFWFDDLQHVSVKPILHIVASVIADLERQGITDGVIGVLGTPATIRRGLYQHGLLAAGYEVAVPDEDVIQHLLGPAIDDVKANQLVPAFDLVARAIDGMKRRHARAVVLGCTELPLAVPHARRPEFGIAMTDSIDALARAAIDWVNAHEPGREGARHQSANVGSAANPSAATAMAHEPGCSLR
ncbi:MAG: aspartate/glutamate racemase family protein [Candidimonas sp.]|nr:MAG: aspartate/glutamate racemase family protein [Candidimonas sp.]